MRRSKFKNTRRRNNRGLTVLTLICAAGLGCLLAGWNATQMSGLSPSEVVALRFPDARNEIFDDLTEARAEATVDEQTFALFNPNPTIPVQAAPAAAATPVTPTYVTASIASKPVDLAPLPSRPGAVETRAKADAKPEHRPEPKVAAVHSKPAAPQPATPRVVKRPGAVLSDGQIASIKTRLNLTSDQQQMWPAVEQALRGLSYTKTAMADRDPARTKTGTIDPGSEEVQRLKSAAFPLIMSFSDDQKRELRIIAHVAGLEKLAAQF